MSRKFIDPIGGRDFLHGPATWVRARSTLPNGDPFWYRTGEDLGAQIPPGTDFYSHPWSFDFWILERIQGWGDHQSFYVNLANSVTAENVWFFNNVYTTRILSFWQKQTDGVTNYRARSTASAISEQTRHYIAVTCNVGATPDIYLDGVLNNGASIAPTGTPHPVRAEHRFKSYGFDTGSTNYGLVAKPAYYPKVLSAQEIANIYASMESA